MRNDLSTKAERACVFGEHENLVGVYHPAASSSPHRNLAVLILTPGMLHSAGPFRLHVDLARALGDSGLASLRFDLSGIGESLALGSGGSSLERARSEISAAIDYLQSEYSIERVACFGLCSGADDAVFAALEETRITAVYALDGCGYRTTKFYAHRLASHYFPKLTNPRKWLAKLSKVLGAEASAPESLQLGTDVREFPNRDESEDQLLRLVARGVALHFHYTGGVSDYYNYAGQFEDMFPTLVGNDLVSRSFQPESDHVAYLCEHRRELVECIRERLLQFASLSVSKHETVSDSIDANFPALELGTALGQSQPTVSY